MATRNPAAGTPVGKAPAPPGRARGLAGLRIASFESRRAQDLAVLIRSRGGEVVPAAALRQIPLVDEPGIIAFGRQLFEGSVDALVLFTGVGTTILVDSLCTRWPRPAVLSQLGQTPLLCRGPKPAAALRALGLEPRLVTPEPHTHVELLGAIDRELTLAGRHVFVQDSGALHDELINGLLARAARVSSVRVYRWALPDDTRELRQALRSIVEGSIDAAVFTSAHQVDNTFEFAARLDLVPALQGAFQRQVLVASIGPVTSDALARHGVHADLSPEQPKLGALVDCLAKAGARLQHEKQRQQ